jgi:PadR family transcriptional regulator, regulatory protein AphA
MEIILLGILAEKPMHGYDLFKNLNQPGGLSEIWHINQSNLYAILEGLESQGYLVSHLIQIGSSPTRKEYHITTAGSLVFEHWMQEPVLHGRDMRQTFLAKLYFAVKDSPDSAMKLVIKQKSIAEAWMEDILTTMRDLTVEDQYDRLVLDSRMKQINAWLEWLDECSQSQIINRHFKKLED